MQTVARLVLALVFLSGCASLKAKAPATPKPPSLLVAERPTPPSFGQLLTPEEIETDVSLLSLALKKGYSGLPYHPSEALALVESDLKELTHAPRTLRSLCMGIANALNHFRDGHLTASIEDGDCGEDEYYVPFIGRNLAAEAGWSFLTGYRWVENDRVGIIAISRFKDPDDDLQPGHRILRQIEEAIRSSQHMILDMRGNRGGFARLEEKLAMYFTSEQTPRREEDILANLETLALRQNREWLGKKRTPEEIEKYKKGLMTSLPKAAEYLAIHPAMEAKFLEAFKKTTAYKRSKRPDDHLTFNGPLYVLVDDGCASACESMLEDLEGRAQTWILGKHTSGAVRFFDPGLAVLPKSGIEVRIPTAVSVYSDGRDVEKKGYQPHITVANSQDALEVALNEIKRRTANSKLSSRN